MISHYHVKKVMNYLLAIPQCLSNGLARTLKKLCTSKGDCCIE